ncbi:MAG TPA: hypothetical protein VFO76_08950 [Candidatus Kapabacteria bacterium]|nr:hypothetical protein [Candidatus Kapabacteria bacterium]
MKYLVAGRSLDGTKIVTNEVTLTPDSHNMRELTQAELEAWPKVKCPLCGLWLPVIIHDDGIELKKHMCPQ